jgi:alpha-L-fucosidase
MRPYPLVAYPRPEPARWARFRAHLLRQLRHLLTAYGPIDVLWFDGGWERTAAEWGSDELVATIRALQPDIVINDRLPGAGDYATPEQALPAQPPDGPWETCVTMNHSWGNVAADPERKSVRQLLGMLAETACGGGNLLVNVSPDGDGRLPAWQAERLDGMAAWMARHRAAILGTQRGLAPWQFYGPTTRRGDRTYLLCPMRPQELVVLRGVYGRRITGVRALGSGAALNVQLRLSAIDRLFGSDPLCDVLIEVPDAAIDETMTVIEVTARADGALTAPA